MYKVSHLLETPGKGEGGGGGDAKQKMLIRFEYRSVIPIAAFINLGKRRG